MRRKIHSHGRMLLCTLAAAFVLLPAAEAPASALAAERVDHSAYDTLLHKYVTPAGVRYAAWHADAEDRAALAGYLERMQALAVSRFEASTGGRAEALAYWLNLYNAATLDLVLDGYPVKSIKDLGGMLKSPWERDVVIVEGRELSLNAIENDILRKDFDEPRIHFALNCAAKSCPPLRAEAYVPERLDAQLADQTRRFLADGATNGLREDGALQLSKIFDWYAKDFEAATGSVVAFVRPYLPALAALPANARPRVRYADYDWSLNESPREP